MRERMWMRGEDRMQKREGAALAVFVLVWILGILGCIAFWCLVGYGVWEGIQWLKRN